MTNDAPSVVRLPLRPLPEPRGLAGWSRWPLQSPGYSVVGSVPEFMPSALAACGYINVARQQGTLRDIPRPDNFLEDHTGDTAIPH
jgi:hypothetical protein